METNSMNTTRSNMTLRPRTRKWSAGIVAMLMGATLVLAACGDTTPPVVQSTPVATMASPADDADATPEASDDADVATPEATIESSEEMTGTEGMDDSDTMTDTEGMDDSDTMTGTEGMDDSDTMTDTEGTDGSDASATPGATVTASEEMTDTEDMDDSDASAMPEATVTPSEEMTGTEGMDSSSSTMPAMMGVSGVDSNQYVRASTLLDYDFENMDGEVSGDLEDLLIDLSTGRILFASIEYGGILDLGDKDIVVPMNAFALGEEGELVLNIDEAALENYPDVGNDWPNLDDPAWDDDVWGFWNDSGIESGMNFDQPTTTVAWASDLMDDQIADLGMGAGSILDILVNIGRGQAPYIIVDYGEGLDTDPYIIPLSAYDVTNRDEGLVYGPDFTPDLLDSAPRFDREAYPDGTPFDTEFGDRIESAWNDLGFSHDLNQDNEID